MTDSRTTTFPASRQGAGAAAGGATRRPGRRTGGQALVSIVAALSGFLMLAGGVWALLWPRGFAAAVRYAYSEHFVHDLGAFQVGLGLGLLLSLLWRDALACVLAAFLVANTLHAANHAADLDVGGRAADPWLLAALSVLVALALWQRLGRLGFVAGHVLPAATPALGRFVEQKTVVLTTYRRDGTPVPTPVSLAVDGDRAVVRSFEKAGKTRRLRNDPTVEVAPSTWRGVPDGPPIRAQARRLDGPEARRAARILRRKYPLLHGVLVPLAHRAGRARTGRTVHFELAPEATGP
ncbi:MAG TPA: PPOX class F420-dependent oxidoreductase [Acidimicrobiales bacterium]|nr:PPOX class F420-dependent oxidoreductase [Acidimicrobiales bacterium]